MKLESIALTPLRLMAFSILSLFRPIVLGLLDGFAVLALIGIVGSAIFGYWFVCGVMVATGVCSISLVWSYDAILSRLVPYDFAVLSNP